MPLDPDPPTASDEGARPTPDPILEPSKTREWPEASRPDPAGARQADVANGHDTDPPEALEKEARLYGWVPKEEYRGSDKEWVDAQSFVERGKAINPILRKNNEALLKRIDKIEHERDQERETFKEFQKHREATLKKEFDTQMKTLREAKKLAIDTGDGAAAVEADEAIEQLKNQEKPVRTVSTTQPAYDPVFAAWSEENDWFGKDPTMTAYANAIGPEIRKQDPYSVGKSFLEKVTEEVKARFHERFKGERHKPISVEAGRPVAGKRSNGKGYQDLPPDAKQACDRFVAQKLTTREQYLKDYFEGDE